jgi:hypothetical protein
MIQPNLKGALDIQVHMNSDAGADQNHISNLSRLVFSHDQLTLKKTLDEVAELDGHGRSRLLSVAQSHHVVIRALQALRSLAAGAGDAELTDWTSAALNAEHARIQNALLHLDLICRTLEEQLCPVVIVKTLDHWPDFGNDIDLCTTAHPKVVNRVFCKSLKAHLEPRSWGDRLANKWNFTMHGLPESVEAHVQRLGQTGEHLELAPRLVERSLPRQFAGYTFRVPAAEERVILSTLQRMYRHFYIRICDVLNISNLIESGTLDFAELRRATEACAIWPGVATYLRLISDYLSACRGHGLELPHDVLSAARFSGERLFVNKFVRFPVFPEAAELYALQVSTSLRHRDFPATLRLSLLPPLASAAAISYKLTGSDKGVW